MLSAVEWIKLGIITQWNNRKWHESKQITPQRNNTEKLTKVM